MYFLIDWFDFIILLDPAISTPFKFSIAQHDRHREFCWMETWDLLQMASLRSVSVDGESYPAMASKAAHMQIKVSPLIYRPNRHNGLKVGPGLSRSNTMILQSWGLCIDPAGRRRLHTRLCRGWKVDKAPARTSMVGLYLPRSSLRFHID